MGEEFYAIIKLISGEEILSLVMVDENDGDPVIVLQNPITIKTLHNQQGTYLKVKSWIELSSDDFFIVKLDKIITMTETKDKRLIDIYNNFVEDEDSIDVYNPSGKVKPSSKMGYIASVEDSRKRLERLFKGIKES
jgi:sulfatase maturation enzyme AslB (radical SAM superfamily)